MTPWQRRQALIRKLSRAARFERRARERALARAAEHARNEAELLAQLRRARTEELR